MLDAAIKKNILVPYDPEAKARRDATVAAAKEKAERIARIKAKKWPPAIERSVINREAHIGMTAEQVTMALGKPQQINRSVGSWGVHEQWVYGGGNLYFENGIVTSFQDRR